MKRNIMKGISVLTVSMAITFSACMKEQKQAREPEPKDYIPYGMADNLPVFYKQLKASLTFPMAWGNSDIKDYKEWQKKAREITLSCMWTPPPKADFDPKIISRKKRDGYETQKLVINLSSWYKIPAYLLIPDGEGPFPAILLMHDHGAHYFTGKEKVVEPIDVPEKVYNDAKDWVGQYYEGRWVGDYYAKQGYVVLAIDAIFWGERGRKEGVLNEAQEILAVNLEQMGMTFSGVMFYDDLRSLEFLRTLPFVDTNRIGAAGWSMGGRRSWTLSAMTDKLKASACVCWMATTKSLMVPGNNEVQGQNSHSMVIPGIANYLDIPDIASMACPKPTLFIAGDHDFIFPVQGVQDAFDKMQKVWESQGAGDKFTGKFYPTNHLFNQAMQDDILNFFNKNL
jgi:dienelactone hydrolase